MKRPPVPSSAQPISGGGGIITTVWQRFFNALVSPAGAIESVAVSGSPTSFTASGDGTVSISGGTITSVTLQRATTTITLGTPRLIPVTNGDVVTVTYSAAPALYFIPS